MSPRFDVVVAGGGLAGCTAAVAAARKGASVALVERGRRPGSKNVIGGILYTPVLDRLFPDFPASAPVERHIVSRTYGFLTPSTQASFELRSEDFARPPLYNRSCTVRRTAFDPWLTQQARAAGVQVVPSTVVESLLHEGGDASRPVTGVRCGREGGDIEASVVILAEGANALLAEAEGLRPRTRPDQVLLGVKEVLELDAGALEDRFGLEGLRGKAFEFFGDPARGGFGSGFVYTNAASLSVGVALTVSHAARLKTPPHELLDRFKAHPCVRHLLRGARPVEYCAHMLPIGAVPRPDGLVRDGLLLAGDAARLANLSHYKELTNLVTASGEAAGETAAEAVKRGDASAAGLAGYRERLEAGFVLRDIRKFERLAGLLESSPELIERYPRLMVEAFVEHFTVSEKPKQEVEREVLRKWMSSVKPAELRRHALDVMEACGLSLAPLARKMLVPALKPGWDWLRLFRKERP